MISKISRIAGITRPFCQLHGALPYHRISFYNNIKQYYSNQNQKPEKPSGKIEDSINTEMKPQNQEDQNKDPLKSEQTDSIQPSKFGNTMLLASVIALILAYAYMQVQVVRANKKNKRPEGALAKVTGVGKAQIGGQWDLIDTNGHHFGSRELEGSYYLIYFGFTHCPDICPNSLTKLSRAVAKVKKSKEANFFNLKTIFVSVDPDRDTPQKINKFMKMFDEQMIGVTATNNQDPILRECMRKFKIYASKLQFEDADSVVKGRKSYTIDHTILTYLMSDTNEYMTHLGANLGQHDLANLILQKINEDKRQKMKNLKL